MKKNVKMLVGGMAIIGVAVGGYFLYKKMRKSTDTKLSASGQCGRGQHWDETEGCVMDQQSDILARRISRK